VSPPAAPTRHRGRRPRFVTAMITRRKSNVLWKNRWTLWCGELREKSIRHSQTIADSRGGRKTLMTLWERVIERLVHGDGHPSAALEDGTPADVLNVLDWADTDSGEEPVERAESVTEKEREPAGV
jgi:hypothetical protein